MTEDNRGLIYEFIGKIVGTSTIVPARRYKLTVLLIKNRECHPAYRVCTLSDVYQAIDRIKNGANKKGEPYTKNTISDKVRMMKRFFIWLVENGYSNIDGRKLQKIRVPSFDRDTVSADALLFEEEVLKIIESCTNKQPRPGAYFHPLRGRIQNWRNS